MAHLQLSATTPTALCAASRIGAAGQLCDSADGKPAVAYYNPDGTLGHATHYRLSAA